MAIKSISSTQAQNNFGQVLDDITRNNTRYIVERRGIPQMVAFSFDDFARMLEDENERKRLDGIIKEIRPKYNLGRVLEEQA
ncbi:MAG: hypothetical protein AUK32_09970 [Candidatus Aquicultor secundus]|uniref:Antitoxin n=1 Tax=Candidatus Aquicultor secundus TaxID=1973895 RepID=A0A2M7T9U4_9ACTN|nr:type II toxin-antitoxin system Phd/YefM family antitoxin [Candidatus Aquicultor secundus]NCO66723.1 type II toxin-antitoxin system Phd/YefM family antitoxin [Solirubrobacter sp.]OIO83454.1 MAG: hypothetical protein AUK32_09970 [Candidatus Aquicultor secundus]PIU27209.1 MAG: hypothetical protein COT10_04660 [Candidatus Aquicultor secundus]PIX51410.1 MAG: hypothetical protein COZ51_09765 [Candidatus Aquicultor secundus]PIY37800.1 MAG: hypothetical protein COZ03_09465 [Candidatus Aquicultor se